MSSVNMTPALPDDILHLLCEELAQQEQFDTLFNCACASRAFAVPALTNLYRSHHAAPVHGGGDDETVMLATKGLMVQKWSILWRSIIASSLDATLFPYCRYIKTLDFRDLKNLLEDDQFKGKVSKTFFSGPLSRFHLTIDTIRRSGRLNFTAIIDAIGEVPWAAPIPSFTEALTVHLVVTQYTPMLETISGELLSHALVRWAPRLPRLQALELWDGKPLEEELVHASIYENCPNFNSLMIYTWVAEDRDHKLSDFIGAMRPQTLKMIETIRDIGASAETFLALNTHSESLKELKLCVSNDSLPHLSLLRGCTGLEALKIEDVHGITNLEKTQNDVFLETIDWLRKCSSLRALSFTRLQSASAIVTPLLLEAKTQLRRLEIDPYVPKDSQLFHQALTYQRESLRFLSLSGDTDGMFRDDVDILVDSFKQLTNLTTLRLYLVQEVFQDEHIISILSELPLLEDLYITGMEIKDLVLEHVGSLNNVRSVTFSGISKFTTDGLLEFVSRLGQGNQGIRVMIDMADTMLSDEEVVLVRENLWEKVGGTLEYTPMRDPNVPEFESDSD